MSTLSRRAKEKGSSSLAVNCLVGTKRPLTVMPRPMASIVPNQKVLGKSKKKREDDDDEKYEDDQDKDND